MNKLIKMPKIPQFRQVIRDVKTAATFQGLDDNGEPIYDSSVTLPCIIFSGTVKMHGSNASVVINPDDTIHCQSRNRVLTPDSDSYGFATKVHGNQDLIKDLLVDTKELVIKQNSLYSSGVSNNYYSYVENIEDCNITIYGEWCGEGIQKGVALAQLPKMFVIFGVKVSPPGVGTDPNVSSFWLDPGFVSGVGCEESDWVMNVFDFEHYSLAIDFNEPERRTDDLEKVTLHVADRCPVAYKLGVSGLGEGVVWTGYWNGIAYRFKVKDARHSETKIKKLVSISPEKLDSIDNFVAYACTRNRYEHALKEVCPDGLDIRKTGHVINWIKSDISSEESDVLSKSDLTMKDVAGKISQTVKNWYMNDLKEV